MRRVRIMKVPMQYGGGNAYVPYVSEAPVTPEERMRWNQVAGQMRQQPGTGVRNWDHNQDFQNEFLQSQGFSPNRVQAIQADMQQRNQSMPGTVTYGPQGMSKVDNWLGSQTKDQRYVQYQYEHLDSHGNRYPGAAGFVDRGTEPMSKDEMNNWNNSAYQWRSNDQGVPMNASTEEVKQKLYNQPASKPLTAAHPGVNKASWYENGPAPDYSIDSVRQGYAKFGGAMGGQRKKVRVTAIPSNPEMGLGGSTYIPGGPGKYAQQQKGHGYALDRFWSSPAGYSGATSKVQPFGRVGTVLKEAQDGGDINAEKNERILGDFDQDGSMELMNVGGKPHSEGGKDVNVPSNSFVFSDTKDLKIKDPKVLAMFGMSYKRGGYTPAFIAKKYDLNKYKPALNDPNADVYAKDTASLMTDNYLEKLSKLAEIQEKMKHHMGMKNSSGLSRYGGAAPRFQIGGSSMVRTDNEDANAQVGQTVNSVYNMYPGTLTAEGYNHERPTADNMQSFVQQSINPRPNTYGKPIIPNTEAGNAQYDAMRRAGWDGIEDPGKWAQRTQPQAVSNAIAASGMKNAASDAITGNDLGNTYYGPRWQNFTPQGPDWNPTIQNVAGVGDQAPAAGTPPPVPGAAQGNPPAPFNAPANGSGRRWNLGVDPNFYGNLQNVLQIANLRKFQPYEPVPQAVIPDTVFMDPTRAIAAQQEEARSGSEMDYTGDPHAARAMAAMRQGIAGKQAADVIGQYHNQNVMIANEASKNAAAITTDLMSKQAARLSELNKANFLSDRDYQKQMKNLQEEYTYRLQQQHNAEVNRLRYNKWNPYFEMDRSGYYNLKPGVTEAKLQEMYMGRGNSGGGSDFSSKAELAKQERDALIAKGFSPSEAEKMALQNSGMREHERMTTNAYGVPSRFVVSGMSSGQGMMGNPYFGGYGAGFPMMTPDQGYSGYSGYKHGGDVSMRPLMKNGGPTDLLKRTKLKKFVK